MGGLFRKAVCARARGCVCVCVKHLNRCKTSTCYFNLCRGPTMLFQSLQGAAGNVIVLQPTKTAMTFCDIDPGRWIDVPACGFSLSWHGAKPRTPHTHTHPYCKVAAIWILRGSTSLFIQFHSELRLSASVQYSELRAWMINGNLWSGLRNRELRNISRLFQGLPQDGLL